MLAPNVICVLETSKARNYHIMPFFKTVALCVGAAVFYGIVHDQITARLSIEYFTVAHPPIVISDSPTVQGLVWGIVATWWSGVLIGVPLAIVARSGECQPWDEKCLRKPIAVLLIIMAIGALLSGLTGYFLAQSGRVVMDVGYADAIPTSQHVRFVAAAWAHNASYILGFVGGVVLILRIWLARCGTALNEGLKLKEKR
jgi:hypothetical protein